MDNAKLLLQIDNTKLADEDFKNKWVDDDSDHKADWNETLGDDDGWVPPLMCRLKDETEARKELEKDIEDLKKTKEDTRLNCKQTKKEIELVKEELARLNQEHKEVRSET